MISINFEKFSGFYSSKIESLLFDIEKKRKSSLKNFILATIVFLMVFPTQFLVFKILDFIRNYISSDYIIIPLSLFCLMIIPLIVSLWAFGFEYKAIKNRERSINGLKTDVYTRLFKLLGLDYRKAAFPEFENYKNAILKHISDKFISKNKSINIRFFTHYMKFEDGISGVFKDIPFQLADATIIRQCEFKKNEQKAVFKGLLLAVKLNKSIKTETVIKSDNFKLFKINKDIINLEDNEFNKKFKVLADDEVESRYLLTTSFMERLKNFHKSRKDKTIIFFDNSCSESKNMFILTNTGKDNFEIPFNKSVLNEKYYYNLLKELVDMLEIAVALKLEQNIGL